MTTRLLITLCLIALTLLPAQAQEPVTLYGAAVTNLTTLDPQHVRDLDTLDVVQNLFLGLTDIDPQTGAVRPELATAWDVGPDGLTYTFSLRGDVPWVRWDPVARQAEVVRNVTAGDVVNAVHRVCDPREAAPNAHLLAGLLVGCTEALTTPFDELGTAIFAAIGVEAVNDGTVRFTLLRPAAHFPALAAMPALYPIPAEVLQASRMAWVEPGNIVTNGPYLLDEHIRQVRRALVVNPHFPADLRGPGNVARWVVNMVEDQATARDLYRAGRIDSVTMPIFAGDVEHIHLKPTLSIVYLGFAHDKPPFDNPAVRRAFAAALDRAGFTAEVYPGVPMIHFAPPGLPEALPSDQVGVGYDPAYAQEQLAAAGFPGCAGFPGPVELLNALPGEQVAFLIESWVEVLGCDEALFLVETTDLAELRDRTAYNGLDDTRPHLWTGVHLPDYPSVYNWLGDVLWCSARPDTRRACTPTDDLISTLASRIDPAARAELVRQIEADFFEIDGTMPVAPWYGGVRVRAYQPWYDGPIDTDGLMTGFHLDWVTLAR